MWYTDLDRIRCQIFLLPPPETKKKVGIQKRDLNVQSAPNVLLSVMFLKNKIKYLENIYITKVVIPHMLAWT